MRRHCVKFLAAVLLLVLIFSSFPIYGYASSGENEKPEIGEYIQIEYDFNEANTVLHSDDGYIWIGSYGGLARYDSTSIVTYVDDDDSIMRGVNVRTLFEDSKGRLWIGSNDKGVFYYENNEFVRFKIDSANTSDSIRAFAQTDAGIFVASTDGIMLIDNNMEVHTYDYAGIGRSQVAGMLTDQKGYLWIIDNDSVIVLDGNRVVYSRETSDFTSNDCNCIAQLRDGRIMIGTGGAEILILTPNGNSGDDLYTISSMELKDTRPADDGQLNVHKTINCIYEDRFGRIWVCSDDGLGYIDDNRFYIARGINFPSLEHIEMDYEGNLWLASSRQGVMQLVKGKLNDKSMSTRLHGTTVNATQLYEGLLFAATDSGVQVVDPVTFREVSHPIVDLLDGIRVRGLFVDSKGYLWITTYAKYGAVRYKDGEYVSISAANGLASDKTRVAMELPNGDIAISSSGGVSIIRGTEVIKTYTEKNEPIVNPVILALCMDKAGNMYFGSDGNGIYVVDPQDKIHCINSKNGLDSDVILNLKYDEKMKAIWIVTSSSLAYLDAEGVHCLEYFSAGTGSVFDMLFVEDKIWILRNTSIVITTREQLLSDAPPSEYTILDKKDGLTDVTANSRHCVDENGCLYLATSNGVYTVNTRHISNDSIAHRAKINTVYVDGKTYNSPESIVIPANTERLTIEFTALNYTTGSCKVEYQLVGVDKEPIIVDGDKALTRDYNHLRGGNYIFRVSVIDSSEEPSDQVLEMKIRKRLAIYEHFSFIVCSVVLAAAFIAVLICAAVQIRTRTLLNRQERYRSLTESSLRVAARSIDAKDSYTIGHSNRVAILSREIARRLGWSEESVENVYYTALVHDIGKIGIPDSLLTKPSRLTDEEYDIIRTHTTVGYNILKEFEGVPDIELGAKYHHERYDGNGYCEGLSGDDIPLVARIIAVADAYDAMSSSRVYRSKLPPEKAREEIVRCSGSQFDPQIADVMLQMLDDGFDPFMEEEKEKEK